MAIGLIRERGESMDEAMRRKTDQVARTISLAEIEGSLSPGFELLKSAKKAQLTLS